MDLSFSPKGIHAALQVAVPDLCIEVVAETGSTNADVLARIDQLRGPLLLVAEQQTAGRGRAGRSWQSAGAASITCSLAWPFRVPLQALAGLPLAVGVGLAEGLAEVLTENPAPVQLKWPNDVLWDGRKLAGVLIETAHTSSPSQALWAVIGIGMNLSMPAALSSRIDQPAAALPGIIDRTQLLAALLGRLCLTLLEFEQHGFAAFSARWNALHRYQDLPVRITDRGRSVLDGVALGVDETGRLLLDTTLGRRAIVAGDVSLRSLET